MVLALENEWVWDSWYIKDDATWHVYFLKAPKSLVDPELRHWNVSIGHAVSRDLKDWTYRGTCFGPAEPGAWDDYTTWTGSTLRSDDGTRHLFYTGTCRSEAGLYQRIGHAVSVDGHDWQRVGDGMCLDLSGANAAHYESEHAEGHWHDRAMRDPWVIKNPLGDGWLMFFTARAAAIDEANAAGAIGFATSRDLFEWSLKPPVFVGGFGQLEVPQVFEFDGRWYCLFCTAAEHFSKEQADKHRRRPVTGSHYLMAEAPTGPWHVAPGPFLDGALPCRRYAARIVECAGDLRIIGFSDRPHGAFVGQLTDPDRVAVDQDGLLSIQAPKAIEE